MTVTVTTCPRIVALGRTFGRARGTVLCVAARAGDSDARPGETVEACGGALFLSLEGPRLGER